MIFIDVGGHKGETIEKIIKEHPDWKIICFEPNPDLYFYLVEYYKIFGIKFIKKALWNMTEERDFYISEISDGSSLHKEKKNLIKPKKIKVECLRATDLIQNLNNDIILHLNCEGAEFEILEDLLDSNIIKKIKEIIVKFHHQPERLNCLERYEKLIKRLKENKINFKEI